MPGLLLRFRLELRRRFADRGEALADARHGDALDVVVVGHTGIDGVIDELVVAGLVDGAAAFDDLGVEALERAVLALGAEDVVAEIVDLASCRPLDGVVVDLGLLRGVVVGVGARRRFLGLGGGRGRGRRLRRRS